MAPATKGIGAAPKIDGSDLRIGIVHARWNEQIIEPLLEGARKEILAAGVKPANIVVQSVPGSWYASPSSHTLPRQPRPALSRRSA
jgi:6,7-dimethyl-8-ribityllumazine synthase